MAAVNRSTRHLPTGQPSVGTQRRLDPAVLGTTYCIVSALGYTAANVCLRKLAALEADETWVICVKELVTVGVVGPWLAIEAFRRRKVMPPPRALAALLAAGVAVQLAGNLPLQWALHVVGIAIAMPVLFGVMLTSAALLGLVFLKEPLSVRSAAAVGLLVAAIALLSAGVVARGAVDYRPGSQAAAVEAAATSGASAGVLDPPRLEARLVVLGVGAACLCGVMFALLSITVRFTATAQVPVASIVFVITGMGVLSMGTLSLWRLGPERLLATDPEHLGWMLAAGTSNLLAFLAITKGLQLTTVVHANVLNASQVAMGAMAGVLLFGESLNAWSILGIALTIAGTVLFRQPESEDPEVPGA